MSRFVETTRMTKTYVSDLVLNGAEAVAASAVAQIDESDICTFITRTIVTDINYPSYLAEKKLRRIN